MWTHIPLPKQRVRLPEVSSFADLDSLPIIGPVVIPGIGVFQRDALAESNPWVPLEILEGYTLLGSIHRDTVDLGALPSGWTKSEVDGATLSLQTGYIRLLTDPAQANSRAGLLFTPASWAANKRIVVVASLHVEHNGPSATAVNQRLACGVLFTDERTTAEQTHWTDRVAADVAASFFVRPSDGVTSGNYRVNRTALVPVMLSYGYADAGADRAIQDMAKTLDDGLNASNFQSLRSGSGGTSSVEILAANRGSTGATGAQTRVQSVAVYVEN